MVVGAAVTFKEEKKKRYSFSVISEKIDRLNIGSGI